MLKNSKMPEVARLLGVRRGERFRTKFTHNDYVWWFDESGLHGKSKKGTDIQSWACAWKLSDLLNDHDEIRRVPWRPYKGDPYWYVAWTEDGTILTHPEVWRDCFMDYLLLRSRNCFRSKAEAQENALLVYKKYVGRVNPEVAERFKNLAERLKQESDAE